MYVHNLSDYNPNGRFTVAIRSNKTTINNFCPMGVELCHTVYT